ncbi:MAG: hypothetical protein CVT66_02010 [Actinobacteria bacterium HGW-Actinobacteria-6]|jgi:hypothetical protein|nr:MAG: hypothetical protein CVT66_02010 [Actinobacteria bacterium HGW-Actinobacteria-6]
MRRRLNIDPRLATAIGITLVVIAFYSAAIVGANSYVKSGLDDSTTFSSAPAGLKVFYRYLDELGYEPQTLQQFESMPESGTVLIATSQPFAKPASAAETKRLAAWVREGGRVVFAGPYVTEFAQALDAEVSTRFGQDVELRPILPSIYIRGVDSVGVGSARLLPDDGSWAEVLKDSDGSALLVRRVGAGEVVWLADSYAFSNEGIAKADNAQLAVLVAASRGSVYFDEYHHGFARGGGIIERLGAGGQSALLVFAIGVALLLAAYGRRLGPTIGVAETPVARTSAYIDSLAGLYRKAGARREALQALADGLTRALTRRYGSPVMGRKRHPSAGVALERTQVLLGKERIAEVEFVQVAGMLARARREVEGING